MCIWIYACESVVDPQCAHALCMHVEDKKLQDVLDHSLPYSLKMGPLTDSEAGLAGSKVQ